MKVLSLASQKGGASKSTLVTNIASALVNQGKTVLVLDADEQGTTSKWGSARTRRHNDLPVIQFFNAYGDVGEAIDDVSDKFDYILIDTAGHASTEMRSSFLHSDIILTPFRTSLADLDTIGYMNNLSSLAKELNQELIVYALISCAPTDALAKDIKPAREAIGEYPGLILLDTVIRHRQCYMDSIGEGIGVVEMKAKSPSIKKAQEEINSLVKEILDGKHK